VTLSFLVRSDQPPGQAKVSASGDLQLDLPAGSFTGTGLAASLVAQAELDAGRTLEATLAAKGMQVSTNSIAAETVDLAARWVEGPRTIDAKLAGPLAGNLDDMVFELPGLAGSIDIADPALPGGKLAMPIEASLKADVGKERL